MDIVDLLKNSLGEKNVLLNEPMSKHTSFKTGGNADIFVKIDNAQNLEFVLKIVKNNKIPLFILGNGSNILVSDKGIRGIVCKIELNKFNVKEDKEYVFVTVGSRKQKRKYCSKAIKSWNNRI